MAYFISPSITHNSVYPAWDIEARLAPGQELADWRPMLDGGPIPDKWLPQYILRGVYTPDRTSAKFHPDISFGCGTSVSEAARATIEALEPNVHQFFPIEVYNRDGSVREPRRYMLNVCNFADAIVDGASYDLRGGDRRYWASSRNALKVKRDLVSQFHLCATIKRPTTSSSFRTGSTRRS